MTDYLKPSPRLLRVWQLRAAGSGLLPAVAISLFFPPPSPVWWGLTTLWALGYAAVIALYLPMRHASTSYRVDERAVEINTGVLYQTSRSLLLRNLEYLALESAPDERLLGLSAISLFVVGGRVRLSGLTADQARDLMERLSEVAL